MITVELLKKMTPDQIFAYGVGLIVHPWFNDATLVSEGGSLEVDGKHTKVKWVAVRGKGYHDWAIYHSMDANLCIADYFNCQCHLEVSNQMIARAGAKLYDPSLIRSFVPCTDEAFNLYRR